MIEAKIAALIEAPSGLELVRDQIAAILLAETVGQIDQAKSKGLHPREWELEVFVERSNPWEKYQDDEGRFSENARPLVNIWVDSAVSSESNSTFGQQKWTVTYHLDVFGFGVTREVANGGHISGDRDAAFEAHRVVRNVRSIVSAGPWRLLGLSGIVTKSRFTELQFFQPKAGEHVLQHVSAARAKLEVDLIEPNPMSALEIFEGLNLTIRRETTSGQVLLRANYP